MTSGLQLGYAPWGRSFGELLEAGRAAEAAGAETVWVNELHRNALVAAAAVAGHTTSTRVATGIALAFVRSPLTTALAALDIDELSGGRFVLGLGTGVRRVNADWHGACFGKPVGHLRDTVAVIRAVVDGADRGEPIEVEGAWESIRIRGYQRPYQPARRRIPVFIAAVGDQMTALAGEVGDGWIGHELGSPQHLSERVLPGIAVGLQRANRSRRSITVVPSLVCALDADRRQARRWAAGTVAFYATVRTYQPFFAYHGFAGAAAAVRDRFLAGDETGMLDACPDEMVDLLTAAGDPDSVRARLSAYEGIADGVKLSPPTHQLTDEEMAEQQRRVIGFIAA